jgi:hypothetical protein
MTAKKPASKSEAKRVTAQKSRKTSVSEENPPAEASFPAEISLQARIADLDERLGTAEARIQILVDATTFIADEARPVYGLGAVALIFDAVARRFK